MSHQILFFTWFFSAEGLFILVISVPLLLGKVKPNALYGFRSARTLADPQLWYAVNRSGGGAMTVAGAASALSPWIVRMTLDGRGFLPIVLTNGAVTVGAVLAAAAWGFVAQSREHA